MRLRVSMPGRCLFVDMENGAEELFNDMAGVLLGLKSQEPITETNTAVAQRMDIDLALLAKEKPVLVESRNDSPIIEKREGYKGFLHVQCEHCGKIRSFCSKEPLTSHQCRECGEKTDIHYMERLYINCECGKLYKYYTNMVVNSFDLECLNCGTPVAVSYNSKKKIYETCRN